MKRAVPLNKSLFFAKPRNRVLTWGCSFERILFFHELLSLCSPCARDSRATGVGVVGPSAPGPV